MISMRKMPKKKRKKKFTSITSLKNSPLSEGRESWAFRRSGLLKSLAPRFKSWFGVLETNKKIKIKIQKKEKRGNEYFQKVKPS